MKKVIFLLVIATSLVACGGNAGTATGTDSTATDTVMVDTTVKVDTPATPVVDTPAVK